MANIRKVIGAQVLKKRRKRFSRQVVVHNFETAHTAVILFDTSEDQAGTVIRDFVKFLKEQGISPKAYGMVMQKEIPQEMLFWKEYSFITRSDLNWYKSPKGNVCDGFFAVNPDILFDFTREQSLEIRFLVELSNAAFKVGCFTEAENDYDLMINLGEQYDMAFLSEQFKHYISILNPVNESSNGR